MPSVMFVCLGNICRSPAAEEILRVKAASDTKLTGLITASSGLGGWHVGNPADARMREAASERGYELTGSAQQFHQAHFFEFDLILAADHSVLAELQRLSKNVKHKSRVLLFTAFATQFKDQEVPDPYYGEDRGFSHVLDILEDSCDGILEHLRRSVVS